MKKRVIVISAGMIVLAAGVIGYRYVVKRSTGNFRTVIQGQVFRSAQPDAEQLRDWKSQFGIKTVLNLRGAKDSEQYDEEVRAAKELGLTLVDLKFTAVDAAGPENLQRLVAAFDAAERPLLLHCAAGDDRSGVASMIAAMKIGGATFAAAREELSSKYRRLGPDCGGVMALLLRYEEACKKNNVGTGGWPEFSRWAADQR